MARKETYYAVICLVIGLVLGAFFQDSNHIFKKIFYLAILVAAIYATEKLWKKKTEQISNLSYKNV